MPPACHSLPRRRCTTLKGAALRGKTSSLAPLLGEQPTEGSPGYRKCQLGKDKASLKLPVIARSAATWQSVSLCVGTPFLSWRKGDADSHDRCAHRSRNDRWFTRRVDFALGVICRIHGTAQRPSPTICLRHTAAFSNRRRVRILLVGDGLRAVPRTLFSACPLFSPLLQSPLRRPLSRPQADSSPKRGAKMVRSNRRASPKSLPRSAAPSRVVQRRRGSE